MMQIDLHIKEIIATNTTTAKAFDEGYRRLETSRCSILEQTMDDTAYAIGIPILAESMARCRKQNAA